MQYPEREFKEHVDVPALVHSEYEVLRQHTDAQKGETATHVTFEVSAPANSHLSTVVYLEREFDVIHEYRELALTEHYIYGTVRQNEAGLYINSPGFALQNVCKKAVMNFNSASVTEEPYLFVPYYSQLYRQQLTPYVRHSGRDFGEKRGVPPDWVRDATQRNQYLPAHFENRYRRFIDPKKFNINLTTPHPHIMNILHDRHNVNVDRAYPIAMFNRWGAHPPSTIDADRAAAQAYEALLAGALGPVAHQQALVRRQ